MKRKIEDGIEVPTKKPKQKSDISNHVSSLIERLKEEQNVIPGTKTSNKNFYYITIFSSSINLDNVDAISA